MLVKQVASMGESSGALVKKPPQTQKMSTFHKLIEACKHKQLEQIKTILDARPELINRCDRHKRSLLHYVSVLIEDDQGDLERATVCFDHLMTLAEEKLWWHQDQDGLSTLHLAVISSHLPMVEHLTVTHPLASKEPELATLLDREGHSPLHWAVLTNNLASVRLIIKSAGLKLMYQKDNNQASPLHYATQFGTKLDYRNQLKKLLHGGQSFSFSQEEDEESTATDSTKRAHRVLEYLVQLDGVELETKDKDKRSALLWAASSGNSKALEMLLKQGADPVSCDTNGLGALHCAASHGFVNCLEAVLEGAPEKVKVNQPDNLGCTPLFYAILSGNQDCIELLVNHGANLDWQDSKGRTVAHFASLKGQLSSLKLLRDSGGNLWLPNKLGDLPLHYAIRGGRLQVVRWLLEHSPYEHSVNAINNSGRAPIHLAIHRGDVELVEYLTACGANLNQLAKLRDGMKYGSSTSDSKYETALDLAKRLDNKRIVDFLIKNSAKQATQVLSERHLIKPQVFQSVEIESPIGFETSCSSVSPKQSLDNHTPAKPNEEPIVDVNHESSISDSTGSSTMSDSSATSLQETCRMNSRKQEQQSTPISKGGISYSNDHIYASIKCKLYPSETHHQTETQEIDTSADQQANKIPEVITNVRVYTSPCQNCHLPLENTNNWVESPYYHPASTYSLGQIGYHKYEHPHHGEAQYYDEERPMMDRYDSYKSAHQYRSEGELGPRLDGRVLEVDDEDERLPVILSEQELSSCSASPIPDQESNKAATDRARKTDTRSPANEEPRFDRFEMETRRLAKKNVISPVAEYIHSGPNYRAFNQHESSSAQRQTTYGKPMRRVLEQPYYKVPAKVDTHWHHRPEVSKSSIQSPLRNQYDHGTRTSSRMTSGSPSRSVSRQTVIKTPHRRLSDGSEELASRVEKAIWKYRQETKLFEELQNLKRSQIRSGNANEAVLVKRLLDRLRIDASNQLIGLDKYQGPYTYKSYERYLYDQLRKLSMSNRSKLNADQLLNSVGDDEASRELNDDARAELELRRILEDSDRYSESSPTQEPLKEGVSDEKPLESAKESQREAVHNRCMSRDSTQSKDEVHQEKPDVPASESSQKDSLEEEADNLSNSIIVDALDGLNSVDANQKIQKQDEQGNDADSRHEKKLIKDTSLPADIETLEETLPQESKVDETIDIKESGKIENTQENDMGDPDDKLPASSEKLDEPTTLENIVHKEISEGEKTVDLREVLNTDESLAGKSLETASKNSKQGRRRSVINIGNKVDVIYHDIGIEIEPAPANPAEGVHESLEDAKEEKDAEPAAGTSFTQEETGLEELVEEDENVKEEQVTVDDHLKEEEKKEKSEEKEEVQIEPKKEEANVDETQADSTKSKTLRRSSLSQTSFGYGTSSCQEPKKSLVRQAVSVTDTPESTSSRKGRLLSRSSSKDVTLPTTSSPVNRNERARKWRSEKGSDKTTRKRPRSIPPGVLYRPRVDISMIHDRWSEIKTQERSKLRSCNDLRKASDSNDADYLLIYEINRSFCHRQMRSDRQEMGDQVVTKHGSSIISNWCQKRLARIVDARRLKRTLSLPECFIYSNNLLRQFEILKL